MFAFGCHLPLKSFPCLCALLDDHLGLRVDERQSDGADPPHGEPGKRCVGTSAARGETFDSLDS